MAQASKVLRRMQGGYSHWCPGCNSLHAIAVERAQANGARWSFDGNLASPTFSPSINISAHDDEDGTTFRCHYFIRNGQIEFCVDTTHSKSGQTMPLPELPEHYRDRAE